MKNNAKTALGLLALGVAIGIILAPDKGSELRKKIMGTIDDLGEQLGDMLSEAKGKWLGLAEMPEEDPNKLIL